MTYLRPATRVFSESMSSKDPPGFKRVDVKGRPISYLTIPDPSKPTHSYRTLTKISQVKEYLEKQGLSGGELDTALSGFDFTKRGPPERGSIGKRCGDDYNLEFESKIEFYIRLFSIKVIQFLTPP